jgi:hypothetical protein
MLSFTIGGFGRFASSLVDLGTKIARAAILLMQETIFRSHMDVERCGKANSRFCSYVGFEIIVPPLLGGAVQALPSGL